MMLEVWGCLVGDWLGEVVALAGALEGPLGTLGEPHPCQSRSLGPQRTLPGHLVRWAGWVDQVALELPPPAAERRVCAWLSVCPVAPHGLQADAATAADSLCSADMSLYCLFSVSRNIHLTSLALACSEGFGSVSS